MVTPSECAVSWFWPVTCWCVEVAVCGSGGRGGDCCRGCRGNVRKYEYMARWNDCEANCFSGTRDLSQMRNSTSCVFKKCCACMCCVEWCSVYLPPPSRTWRSPFQRARNLIEKEIQIKISTSASNATTTNLRRSSMIPVLELMLLLRHCRTYCNGLPGAQ